MGNPYAPPRPGAQKPTDEARQPTPPPVPGAPGAPQGPHQGSQGPQPGPPPGHGQPGRPAGLGGPSGPGGLGKPDPLAQVDPEKLRATTRQVLHFGLLMLVTLVTSSLAFPWRVASLFFAVVTIVFGVRALRAVWRARLGGALLPAVAVGLGLTVTMSLSMIGGLAMWDIEMDNQACLDGAITVAAQEECAVRYEQAREQWTTDQLGR